ncbi:MAG TPA: AtpZ/AtpI family protein [Actinomycetales bacterium]|jgi:F0F1-type ATP synthase assembly protein I|nr:AtpZ/AtpI family protein [Actinomycetales bacterium]
MDHGNSDPPQAGLRGRDLLGLGGFLVAAVVGGLVVGLLLDHALGTSPVFVLVGIAVGIVSAAVGFWSKVRAALRE